MSDLPDSWIQVWFADQSTACVRCDRETEDALAAILDSGIAQAIALPSLDGAKLVVRSDYIQGYVVSKPECRVISRAFEKARKEETKASKSWDDEE